MNTSEQTLCFVPGCNRKRESGDNAKPRSFYRIPAIISSQGEEIEALSTRRRNAWVEAMGSKETILKSSRICSAHFVNGKTPIISICLLLKVLSDELHTLPN